MTRARAIELLKGIQFCCDFDDCTNAWDCDECVDAFDMAIEALEQEPKPSEVARDMATIIENEQDMRVIALQQEPKRGKWIDHTDEGFVECPFCHSATTCEDNIDELKFCFSCGARMESDEQ